MIAARGGDASKVVSFSGDAAMQLTLCIATGILYRPKH